MPSTARSTASARLWIAVLTAGVIVAAFLVAVGVWSPVRAASGVVLVLFLPGYLLTLAAFPDRHRMGQGERIVLSVGLSIVVSVACGLLAAAVSQRATATNVAVTLGAVGLAAGAIAWARADASGRRQPQSVRAPPVLASAILVGSLALFVVAAVTLLETPTPETFTELRVSGLQSGLPVVSLVNREGKDVRYRYVIAVNGRERDEGVLRVQRDSSRPVALPQLASKDRVTVTVFRPPRSASYRVISFTVP